MAEKTGQSLSGHGTNNVGPLSVRGRMRSFRYAVRGIILMLKSQHNAWLHGIATIVVLSVGGLIGLSEAEWCWLVLAIVVVWTAEALNTAGCEGEGRCGRGGAHICCWLGGDRAAGPWAWYPEISQVLSALGRLGLPVRAADGFAGRPARPTFQAGF